MSCPWLRSSRAPTRPATAETTTHRRRLPPARWPTATRLGIPLLALSVLGVLAGCGDAGEPVPPAGGTVAPASPGELASRAALAARAAAAQDQVGISFYTLSVPGREDRTVMVVRAADGGWRVDVPGAALDGAADLSIASHGGELFHCALADPPRQAGCVAVAALTPEIDPRVQHVFTSWPRILTDRGAAIAVTAAVAPDGLAAAGAACFHVQPSAASLVAPLDAGVYCYTTDGTLTGADLELGTLSLVNADPTALPSVDLPGPVVAGEPLPLVAPSASPDPSPAADPAGDG